MKELDIISLLISSRKLNILSSVLLNKHQTLLMNFSNDNMIHSEGSESSDDVDIYTEE